MNLAPPVTNAPFVEARGNPCPAGQRSHVLLFDAEVPQYHHLGLSQAVEDVVANTRSDDARLSQSVQITVFVSNDISYPRQRSAMT